MSEVDRRQALIGAAAFTVAAALPSAAAAAIESAAAEMFFTSDEPWGAFVRGHVPTEQFETAIFKLLDTDRDIRDNGEGWLFENAHDEEGNHTGYRLADRPCHGYMRVGDPNPDFDETYYFCKADEPGAIPITVIRY